MGTYRVCVYRAGNCWMFSAWLAGACTLHGELGISDESDEDLAIDAARRQLPANASATVVRISDLPESERIGPKRAEPSEPKAEKSA